MMKNKVVFWILLFPLIVSLLFFVSVLDNVSIRFFEESYFFEKYLVYIILVSILISIVIVFISHFSEIMSVELRKVSFSSFLYTLLDLVLVTAFCVLLLFYPVRGCFLIINRTIGDQQQVKIEGEIIEYSHVHRKGGYDNNLYILDKNSSKIIDLRVKDDSVFNKGANFSRLMKKGSLGILYAKY